MLNLLALKGELEKLYLQEKLTGYEVARQLGLPKTTLYRHLEQCEIPRRSNTEAQKLAHLNPESNIKRSLATKGRPKSKEHKQKISMALKANPPNNVAENNPNWKGGEYRPCPICGKKVWVLPYQQRRGEKYCSLACNGIASLRKAERKPNKVERQLIDLINRAELPFKYTGGGSVIIHGFVPDFVNYNGEKQIIELFGDYWHVEGDMRKKAGAYGSYGYKVLFIWEHELKEPEAVITKIKNWSRLP